MELFDVAGNAVAQSEGLQLALALLNVGQTIALAYMAGRSRRVRAADRRTTDRSSARA